MIQGVWRWDFHISDDQFPNENEEAVSHLKELTKKLSHAETNHHKQDRVMWSLNQDGIFSVKFFYEKLREKEVEYDMEEEKKGIIKEYGKHLHHQN